MQTFYKYGIKTTGSFGSGFYEIKNYNCPPNHKTFRIFHRTLFRSVAGSTYNQIIQKPMLASLKGPMSETMRNMGIQARKFPTDYGQKTNHDRDSQGISYHEGSHVMLYDDVTNKLVGILTSSHGKNLPAGVYCAKVSFEKYDGTFIPKIDPKTKLPLFDIEGNPVLDPNKGGQYLAVFPTERILSSESKGYLLYKAELEKKFPYLKAYLQKYESVIQQIIADGQQISNTKKRFSKKLGGKDDEPL